MRGFDNNTHAFLALLRAGLWETEARLSSYGDIDYAAILQLAEEQSVVGLVTAGLEHVSDVKVPQEWVLQFIGSSLQIEQQNKEMNAFVAKLIELLRKNDVYALLVKGQGIAQCYERPLWRASGDVDFLLSDSNYERAKKILTLLADHVDPEEKEMKHLGMTIDQWLVELHGTMKTELSWRVNKGIKAVQDDLFYGGNVRSWNNSGTTVFLPSPDNDVILVFTHLLQHFFIEGVGLKQVCDWCRLLYYYRKELDVNLLEQRIKKMGLLTEWKAFGFLAVNTLGMPREAMPFYDSRFKVKGERVLNRILKSGNMGHNNDLGYRANYSGVSYRVVALWRRLVDFVRLAPVFPVDAPKFFVNYVMRKVCAVRGE
jgi:hypothetical protein